MSLKRFVIGKSLGKGAFGSVYVVTRKEDGQIFAMKQIKLSGLSRKEKDNTLNEIRLLASLSHKNIIGYEEAFFDEDSETLNIVIEYADDGDLASKIKHNIKAQVTFDEPQIWLLLLQILQGLRYLHTNKVMHRDLKSANIFLMKDGTVKLGDLNVSKIAKADMASTQTGTPYYTSPEIWQDKPYDKKCDIWSVGCLIYELCTNRPPFKGNNFKQLFDNIIKGVYEPISSKYSSQLSQIISQMLRVSPNSRPNCEELLNSDIISGQNGKIIYEGSNGVNNKIELIGTIRMPKNLRDINKELPSKRKRIKVKEEEMMGHDKYEIRKCVYKANNFSFEKQNERKEIMPKVVLHPLVVKPLPQTKNCFIEKAKEEIHLLVGNNSKESNKGKFVDRIQEIKSRYIPDQKNGDNGKNDEDASIDQANENNLKRKEYSELLNKDNNKKYDTEQNQMANGLKDKKEDFYLYFQEYKRLKQNQHIENKTEKKGNSEIETKELSNHLILQGVKPSNTHKVIDNCNEQCVIKDSKKTNKKEGTSMNRTPLQLEKIIIQEKNYSKRNDETNKINANYENNNLIKKFDNNNYNNKQKSIDTLFNEIDIESQRRRNNHQLNHLKYLLFK